MNKTPFLIDGVTHTLKYLLGTFIDYPVSHTWGCWHIIIAEMYQYVFHIKYSNDGN